MTRDKRVEQSINRFPWQCLCDWQVKSEVLVRLFIERTQELTPTLNAVIVTRYDEALDEARHIDTLLEEGKELPEQLRQDKAPFLGVPFTAKEAFAVTGIHVELIQDPFKCAYMLFLFYVMSP